MPSFRDNHVLSHKDRMDPQNLSSASGEQVNYSKVRAFHAAKRFLNVAAYLLIIVVAYMLVLAIPTIYTQWVGGWWKSKFTQKEGLQYLGASMDTILGHVENSQDSLAEQALRRDAVLTDMQQKATFLSRDHFTTPEEELMKKQQNA